MKSNKKYASKYGRLKAENPAAYAVQKGQQIAGGFSLGQIQERVLRTEANQKRNAEVQKKKKLKLQKKNNAK